MEPSRRQVWDWAHPERPEHLMETLIRGILFLERRLTMVHLRGVYEGKREGDLGVTVATSLLPVL
jgi:hypothetical protein